METIKALMRRHAQCGRLQWIGARSAPRAPVAVVDVAEIAPSGLVGDRRNRPGKRAVTLFQWEHLPVIAALLGADEAIDPRVLRRNLGISGLQLLALRGRYFRVGEAILLGTGPCAPCSRMEQSLGTGGYNAVRGHGGICASVARPGLIRAGDALAPLDDDEASALGLTP